MGESLISLKFQIGWLLVLDILSEGWQMLVLASFSKVSRGVVGMRGEGSALADLRQVV